MESDFLKLSWPVWGFLALIVSGIFAVFVPRAEKVYAATGFQHFVARWFHSLVWLLLSISFFLRASSQPQLNSLANPLAALAGIVYFIFLVVYLRL